MTKLLIVDTETGGLDPSKHSLLSIAFGVWEEGELIDTLSLNIQHETYTVSQRAMAINKIDLREELPNAFSPEQAKEIIWKFTGVHFGMDRAPLVGQNVPFDIGFMKAFFNEKEYDDLFSHRSIDTASIMRFLHVAGIADFPKASLDDGIRYFNISIPESERHTALGDVFATAELLQQLINLMQGGLTNGETHNHY